jgi:hypothetical protein
MKSVDNEWQRVRRFLVGAASTSVVIGFVACSGSSEHKASPHESAGGDGSGGAAAGAPASHQAGSESSQAGETASAGQSAGGAGGESAGGASSAGASSAGASSGGDQGMGGEMASAGQSMGGAAGESAGGGGGAGGEAPFVDPVCGVNLVKVGEYSLWCGKVNEHTDAQGSWQPDPDCTSGCNVAGVAYCQKFYPSATTVVTVPQVGLKDWKNAGFVSGQSGECNDSAPDGVGISGQAACCAPL